MDEFKVNEMNFDSWKSSKRMKREDIKWEKIFANHIPVSVVSKRLDNRYSNLAVKSQSQ
jgi:hypothetical protein